ncbi:MAG: hypothetical protein WD055_05605 [Candidatus Dependentiae bacterium]
MKKIIIVICVCFPWYMQCMDAKGVQKTPSLANLFIACNKMDRARRAIIFERLAALEQKVDGLSVVDLAPMQVALPNKPSQKFAVKELLRRVPVLTELVNVQHEQIKKLEDSNRELKKQVDERLGELQQAINTFVQVARKASEKKNE